VRTERTDAAMATAKIVLRNIDFSMGGETADTSNYAPRGATPHQARKNSANQNPGGICE